MDEIRRALVVDDERNIRLTLRAALESPTLVVDEAADGDAAVDLCKRTRYDVVLLDLRLPGIDGIEVLRRLHERSPETRVVVITAHGTVDSAVLAMKLGAVDFLQKPFEPQQVREIVARALRGEEAGSAPGAAPASYDALVQSARTRARAGDVDAAEGFARRAVALDPARPEAHHVLGAVDDLRGDRLQAQSFYRAALALDPTYAPSRSNLERSGGATPRVPVLLGDEDAPRAR